ncbi:MAG: outer membrane beta-barrel protein [Elusimicrobiota bacterium]
MKKIIFLSVLTVISAAFVSPLWALDVSATAGSGSYQWTDSDSKGVFSDGNTFNVKVRVGLTKHFGLGYSYTSWKTESSLTPGLEYSWVSNSLLADYTFSKLLIFTPYVGGGISSYKNDISGRIGAVPYSKSSSHNGLVFLGGVQMMLMRSIYVDYGVNSYYIFKSGDMTSDRQMMDRHFGIYFQIY